MARDSEEARSGENLIVFRIIDDLENASDAIVLLVGLTLQLPSDLKAVTRHVIFKFEGSVECAIVLVRSVSILFGVDVVAVEKNVVIRNAIDDLGNRSFR